MKKYLHLLVLGATIAATAFAVGSTPKASDDCSECSACGTGGGCCVKK